MGRRRPRLVFVLSERSERPSSSFSTGHGAESRTRTRTRTMESRARPVNRGRAHPAWRELASPGRTPMRGIPRWRTPRRGVPTGGFAQDGPAMRLEPAVSSGHRGGIFPKRVGRRRPRLAAHGGKELTATAARRGRLRPTWGNSVQRYAYFLFSGQAGMPVLPSPPHASGCDSTWLNRTRQPIATCFEIAISGRVG